MTFGERLRQLRKGKGMSQRDLAARIGVSFTYLSKLENCAMRPPGEETILAMARELAAEPDDLLGLAKKIPSQLLREARPEMIRMVTAILEGSMPGAEEETVRREGNPVSSPSARQESLSDGAFMKGADLFRALVENSLDGILVMNADLDVTYETPSAARILGYEPGELAGRDALRIVHPNDVSRIAHEFSRLLENPGGTRSAVARIRHRDGTWRLVEALGKNLLDDPAVNGVVIDYREITRRSQIEQERARAEAVSRISEKHGLTGSEEAVLALVVEGKSNSEIADRLVTKRSTVKFHVSNILRKLEVHNRMQAAGLTLRHQQEEQLVEESGLAV